MDAYKISVPEFFVGQGVSTETPSQLPKQVAYHGVTIKADKNNENVLLIGKNVAGKFPLDAGEEITVYIDDSSMIWIVGVGNYSFLIQ